MFLLIVLCSINVYARGLRATAITLDGNTTISVPTTSTVYTDTYRLDFVDYMAIKYQATSSGSVNLKIEMEQDVEAPATENIADADMTEPSDISDVDSSLTDENIHKKQFLPDSFQYYRFKITGQSGNDASTTLKIYTSTITSAR